MGSLSSIIGACTLLIISSIPIVQSHCVDSNSFKFETENKGKKDCEWLAYKKDRQDKYCNTKGWDNKASQKIKYFCEDACDLNECRHDDDDKYQDDDDDYDDYYDDDDYDDYDDDVSPDSRDEKCNDDNNFKFETEHVGKKDCDWLSGKSNRKKKYCNTKGWNDKSSKKVKHFCQESCEKYLKNCSVSNDDYDDDYKDDVKCYDDDEFKFKTEHNGKKDCDWLANKKFRQRKYCEGRGWDGEADKKVKYGCRRSCANYLDGDKFDRCDKYQDDDDDYDYDDDNHEDDDKVSSDSYSGGSRRCRDHNSFKFETEHVGKKDCDWLGKKKRRQRKYCNTKGWNDDSSRKVKRFCQDSCEKYLSKCRSGRNDDDDDDDHSHDYDDDDDDNCSDSRRFKFETEFVDVKDCDWLSEKEDRQEKYCETRGWDGKASSKVKYACKDSCKRYNNC